MKRIVSLMVLVFGFFIGLSQNINKLEYFIDTDPGYGSGTNVPVTPATAISNLNFNVPLSSVADGFHTLFFRARDANGNWSATISRPFYKIPASAVTTAPNINKLEYFIDTDPGYGLGTNVAVTPGVSISNQSFTVALSSVADGFHTLFFRARDANGNWSATISRPFYKIPASAVTTAPNINKLEYFIDTDPGYGLGTNVAVTPATSISNQSFTVPLSSVADGFHTLYFRARDANGNWSATISRPFYKIPASAVTTAPNINKLEYFIDTDPGYGLGTNVVVTPATSISNQSFTVPLSSVADGFHTLFFRTRDANGNWSATISRPFYKIPASAVTTAPNINKLEYFIDTDPGFGLGSNVAVTPATSISNQSFTIALSSVADGFHTLYFRARDANGNWSATISRPFYKIPASAVAALPNIDKLEYFIDADPGYGSGTNVTITPGTSITNLNFNVPLTGQSIGNHTITVRARDANAKWSIVYTASFAVVLPPTITTINPSIGGTGTPVTITGTNFSTTLANNTVKFNGVTAVVTASTATSITTSVPAGATTGPITVTVQGQTATSSTFTFIPQPTITSFSPLSGGIGTTVTITGTNFSAAFANNVVKFNGVTAVVTGGTTTSITTTVPSGATTGPITVTVSGVTGTSATNFTVSPPPTVTSFNPTSAGVGILVTIFGTNFSTTAADNIVKFNGVTALVTASTTTSITTTVPSGALTGKITVTTLSQTGTSATDFIVIPSPIISSFSPNGGNVETTVNITGANFSATANTVKFNGVTAQVTGNQTNSITTSVPAGATTGPITVTVSGLTATSSTNFVVAPSISSFAPSLGGPGTSVTITGLNFSTIPTDNIVTFNGVAATVTQGGLTSLVVTVPTGVSTGSISVTVLGRAATSSTNFVVVPPPTISSFSPGGGKEGATIIIEGTNFSLVSSENAVKFNGVAAIVSTSTSNRITVTVPLNATTGPISVTVSGQTFTTTSNFVITPTIESVDPPMGGALTTVTLKGKNFNPIASNNIVLFNNTPAVVTASDGTSITTSVPAGATTGKISVAVSNFETVSANEFLVLPLLIESFSPPVVFTGQQITILGKGFSDVEQNNIVTINGVTVQVLSSTSTSLFVVIPVGVSSGKITVTVLGQTATSLDDLLISKLRVTSRSFPDFFVVGESSAPTSITVNDVTEVQKVMVSHKGISSTEIIEEQVLTGGSNTISYPMPASAFTDPIGMKVWFTLTDKAGIETVDDADYIYLKYPATSKEQIIPGLSAGKEVSNYQIISIPLNLTNKSTEGVFKDLGKYDDRAWRLFSFENSRTNENPTEISIGSGYWLITRDKKEINPGEGTTVEVTEESPHKLSLKSGWNLIGNPYNFIISWDDVLEYNGNPSGVKNLRQYISGAVVSESLLSPYRGAFVESNTAIEIEIPIISHGMGGRKKQGDRSPINSKKWEINFSLEDGEFRNELFGFGMNPGASENRDEWDETALPMLEGISSFEMKLRTIDEEILAKDFVPTQDQYTWVAQLNNSKTTIFKWDNSYFGENEKQLIIDDSEQVELVNMRLTNQFVLAPGNHLIKIHYGDSEYVTNNSVRESLAFGSISPNPVKQSDQQIRIAANLPNGKYEVSYTLFDTKGKSIIKSDNILYQAGRYDMEWNADLSTVVPGLYLLRIEAKGEKGSTVASRKVIIE